MKLLIKLRFRGCTFYSENSGIKRNISVPLWAECKNTEQPYGGKEAMENTDKNGFKNMAEKLKLLQQMGKFHFIAPQRPRGIGWG